MHYKINVISVMVVIVSLMSCNKYLDKKSDKSLVIPSTIKDLQALLDNTTFFNYRSTNWDEVSADNYYLPLAEYNFFKPSIFGKLYTWEAEGEDIGPPPNDWSKAYDAINYANIVLDGIQFVPKNSSNEIAWDNIKGSALVFRAQYYLNLVTIFCKSYDPNTAGEELGLPLRLTPDFNLPSVRASLQATYNRIIADLTEACPLLPDNPIHVMRPSKPAAYGILARTYLAMRNYDSSFNYADLCLSIKGQLMNFNNDPGIDRFNLFPIKSFNNEVIFNISMGSQDVLEVTSNRVDSILANSYNDNDLRKSIFLLDASIIGETGYFFQGSYDASNGRLFTGLATDEMYLTRAECNARLGNKEAALSDLNYLMENRWKSGFFVPFTATSLQQALDLILQERRKELLFRCLRWMDIKRFNSDGANIILKREINGTQIELHPNDNKYAIPLPKVIIDLTGMPQNPR